MSVFSGTDDDRTESHKEGVRTQSLRLELTVEVEYDETGTEIDRQYAARYILVPEDIDGKAVMSDRRMGNAVPHLTDQEISNLKSMMDSKVDDANTYLGS